MNENTASSEFVITRVIDAPRERVWRAWTDQKELQAWFGPKGAETFHSSLDLRPGGNYHYGMRYAGTEMWAKWTFREIVPPERLVFITAFSNKDGGLGRHPFAPAWPQQWLCTVLFADHSGKTLITVKSKAFEATEAEEKTFGHGFDSMKGGWGGTFDRLDAFLLGKE